MSENYNKKIQEQPMSEDMQGLINGVEMALDMGMPVSREDYEMYQRLTARKEVSDPQLDKDSIYHATEEYVEEMQDTSQAENMDLEP